MLLIFFFSLGSRYFVYYRKGIVQTQYYNLLIARNWAQTGNLSYESADNIVLSTETIASRGMPTNFGNKLTFFLYGFLFRVFGFHPTLPMHVTFFLYALSSVFIFLIVKKKTDLKTGIIAALLFNLAPFSLPFSQIVGSHEWAWFFLVLAAFFFFWPEEKKLKHLILVGLLLGLSAAAKNSFFVAMPPFVLLEFWQNRKNGKKAVMGFSVMSAVFLFIAAPFFFVGGNIYLSELFGAPNRYSESSAVFGHMFPDPYTFHYDKEAFLKNHIANYGNAPGGQFQFWGDQAGFLEEYGFKVGFIKEELITRLYSVWVYLRGFLSLVVFGGFFTWFLLGVGVQELLKRKNYSFVFFSAAFFVSWFLFLVFLKTSNYAQLLILSLPLIFLAAAGVSRLSEFFSEQTSVCVATLLLLFFFQISWWSLRELSLGSGSTRAAIKLAGTEEITNSINRRGTTATGWPVDLLVYYADRDFVYFAPDTIKKLAGKKELSNAFKKYDITGYLGFDAQTSELIKTNTNNLKEYK